MTGMTDIEVSAREAEVLAALGEHQTNAEIAARLFISVRTVESHVSSLLRKLGADDRRGLAAIARERAATEDGAGATGGSAGPARPAWPAPLTTFVGRVAERAQLADAIGQHRLVTAVGPGGAGKTRLALAVATQVRDSFDESGYADLVPLTQDDQVVRAVAAALGLGEQQGRSVEQTVLGRLGERPALLVLDNCEHVLAGVAEVVERLLAGAPGLVVLATSRTRLMLPFEQAVPVGGLSLPGAPVGDGDGDSDALALFRQRAEAAGAALTSDDDEPAGRICVALEGLPLAVELAAARVPSLGLDGVEAGLTDRLDLLTGARRTDHRHGSLRSTLDWSHALLDPADQAVLRRVSVFVGPFDVEAAAAVVGGTSVPSSGVRAHLARLADHSLVVPSRVGPTTRYAVLESIRQYGAERLDDDGEAGLVHRRHLQWCRDAGRALVGTPVGTPDGAPDGAPDKPVDTGTPARVGTPGWRDSFDLLAGELRAALTWAGDGVEQRDDARAVAALLALACYWRGMPGEAQERYEQAASLTAPEEPAQRARELARAAEAARARLAGDDAIRLHRAAAAAALEAGDEPGAAGNLARAVELVFRSGGIVVQPLPAEVVRVMLDQARSMAGDDPAAQARLAVAEAFTRGDDDPSAGPVVERAVELARRLGDPLAESAALDRSTTILLGTGRVREALEVTQRRTHLLAGRALDPDQGFELPDAFNMATESAIAAGELVVARRMAESTRALPQHREIGHIGSARVLTVTALTGEWDETVAVGETFLASWQRDGRPRIPSLRCPVFAVAAVHGMRGDDDAHDRWQEIAEQLSTVAQPPSRRHGDRFFEALRLVHLGRPDEAVACLVELPAKAKAWFENIWRPWYAALQAEAAVLAGDPRVEGWLDSAQPIVADNVVAAAMLQRAAALAAGDRNGVLRAADALAAASCRYQWARSLVLAGGADRERGLEALRSLGATSPA